MLQLSRAELLRAYRNMRMIRSFEDAVHEACESGEIPGFVHLCAGQEASAVGVCIQLAETDYVASTHRAHGHYIAKGGEVATLMKEIYGKAGGVCKGRGGSMHVADLDKGLLGANGINAAGLPLICGAALTAKTLRTGGIAVAFVGEGAVNQGTAFESLNLAAVWKLPAIFVVENNGYACTTTSSCTTAGGGIVRRAEAFGVPGQTVDGTNFFDVYDAFLEASERGRGGGGPTLLELKLHRWYGHFEGDLQAYRATDEVARLRSSRDCLALFRHRVTETMLLENEQLDGIDGEVAELIRHALDEARAAPYPAEEDLLSDVYTSY